VAVLARDGKRSVRTARGLPLRCGHGSARCRPREEQQATQDLNGRRVNVSPCFRNVFYFFLSVPSAGRYDTETLLTVSVLKEL
jgi:hypothetical protein